MKGRFITEEQLGVLSKLDKWAIYDIPTTLWDKMPYVHRQESAVAIYASGCAVSPQSMNGHLATIGMDVIVHEQYPKRSQGEDEINVYHFTVQKLAKKTPEGQEYFLQGPYRGHALQTHWPSAEAALGFYSNIGTVFIDATSEPTKSDGQQGLTE
jgi:hypothetical protein